MQRGEDMTRDWCRAAIKKKRGNYLLRNHHELIHSRCTPWTQIVLLLL